MAYIVESTSTIATGTSQTIDIGSPLTNDLILIFLGVGGSATYTTPTGYTQLYVSTNTVRQYCWYKVATSDSEADPTTTASFSSSSAFVTVIVRDVDTTTPITNSAAGFATSTFTNVKEVAAPTLTTGVGKTKNLVLHAGSILTDSVVSDFAKTTAVGRAVFGGTMFVAKEWVEGASSASATFNWLTNQSASRTGNLGVVSINNKTSGGDGLRDISCLMTNTRLVKPYPYGTSETLSAPNVILSGATPLDGLVAASSAAGVSTTGTLSNSYLTSLNVATATNHGADTWAGFSWPTPTTLDLTGKIVGFAWNPSNSWSTSTTDNRGVAIVFSDSTGDWVAYQVRPLASAYLNTDHIEYISPGVSTAYGSSGTISWNDITNITWVYARQSGQTAQPILNIASMYLFDGVSTLVGGSSTKPINGSQIYKHVTQYIDALGTVGLYPFGAFQGSGQFLGYTPIQIGNGTIPTYANFVANSLETPPASTRTNDFDVTDSAYGMTLYGSSTCTFDLRSAIIASSNLADFTMHASSSLSASLLTTGASFVGRTFSDLAGYSWSTVSWSSCDTVTVAGGGDLTNCTISTTASTNAALAITADGSVLDGCTIDGTGAAYAIELGTAVTAVTLTDCTITAGSTDKVHVLKTTGTVTITISGTTSLVAGDVTSAGATVVISAPVLYQSVVVTGFTAGSRLQIYDVDYNFTVTGVTTYPAAGQTYTDPNGVVFTVISSGAGAVHAYGVTSPKLTGTLTLTKTSGGTGDATITYTACSDDGTELFNGTASAGNTVVSGSTATWTDSAAASAARYIRLRRAYKSGTSADAFLEQIIGTCGITEGTETVTYLDSPESDTVYEANAIDGSTVTTVTFTDASVDVVNVDVGSGGTISLQSIYAAWVDHAFGAVGIAKDIDYIDAIDPANYVWQNLKVKNTSSPSVKLRITGGYFWDAITGQPDDCIDDTGGTIFVAPPHVVAYATGSGALTGSDITSIWSAANRTLTATTNANVVQVGGTTVTGSGTESDPWGP